MSDRARTRALCVCVLCARGYYVLTSDFHVFLEEMSPPERLGSLAGWSRRGPARLGAARPPRVGMQSGARESFDATLKEV